MSHEDPTEAQRMLALLESQHDFPGAYSFKIFYRNQPAAGEAIVAAIASGCSLPHDRLSHTLRSSSGARFVSMTLRAELEAAAQVLEVYRVLGALDSVISYL